MYLRSLHQTETNIIPSSYPSSFPNPDATIIALSVVVCILGLGVIVLSSLTTLICNALPFR